MAGWTGPTNKVSRLSNPSDPPWRSSTNLGVSRPQPWPASQLGLGPAGLFSPVFSCLLLCSRSAGPPSLALPWQLTTADHFSVFVWTYSDVFSNKLRLNKFSLSRSGESGKNQQHLLLDERAQCPSERVMSSQEQDPLDPENDLFWQGPDAIRKNNKTWSAGQESDKPYSLKPQARETGPSTSSEVINTNTTLKRPAGSWRRYWSAVMKC